MNQILIIDDEPHMRHGLGTILRCEGYEVEEAPDGLAGVQAARRRCPDLVLCDILMPGLDGFGVLAALRANSLCGRLPLIFLSARGEKSEIQAGRDQGADDYLVKPVSRDDLVRSVTRWIRRPVEWGGAGACVVDWVKASDPSLAFQLQSWGLTPRESVSLFWLARGLSDHEIGRRIGAAESTVRRHIEQACTRLGLGSRVAAAARVANYLSSPTCGEERHQQNPA